MLTQFLLLSVCIVHLSPTCSADCGPNFHGLCSCGNAIYQDRRQYVVNCTNTQFKDTSVLQYLPEETQVLIFTGNSIPELPWNVFGTLRNYSSLRVVDMSDNKIHEVLGKSYHRVSNVERLILNHNDISIASQDGHHHPRIFSNFVNLRELHLTNAFAEKSENLAADLHDIFVNSNLTNLIKLHLELNEISVFQDRKVFCDLPNLMDLHLGENLLTGLDFDINCLHNLRFIDLEQNKIEEFSEAEYAVMDSLPARNQSLIIDISHNPFSCDCAIHDLFAWFQTTKVTVRNMEWLRCYQEAPQKRDQVMLNTRKPRCVTQIITAVPGKTQNQATAIVLGLLTIILVSLLAGLLYANRKTIQYRLNPILDTVSRKVHYTSIGHQEEQEVNV